MLLFLLSCTANEAQPTDTSAPPSDTQAPADTAPPADTEDTDTEETTPAAPSVVINELMAANGGAVLDDLGGTSDWIELYNTTSADLDLSGFTISDDWTEPDLYALPDGTILEAGAWLVLWADGLGNDPLHMPFRLSSGGEGVGVFSPDGESIDWQVYPALSEDIAYARIPDGADEWQTTEQGTPGSTNRIVMLESIEVVSASATWQYWDRGESPADGWQAPGFDDSAWGSGPAPLGYGDSHQLTTISYGDDSSNKHTTAYYRTTFTLDALTADGASTGELDLMCDDGCIVYLNGTELVRHNMAEGEVTTDTFSSATVSGDGETSFNSYTVDASMLVEGENVLSGEAHQANLTSSDTTFDVALVIQTIVEK